MKLKPIVLTIFAAALWAQSGADLFQQALRKERSEGDLAGAIRIYERILKERGVDRKLASRALLQIAQCQERQGGENARRTYERLLKEFADQPEAASEARARIAALSAPAAASTAPRVRQLWAGPDVDTEGSVSPDGRWLTFANWDTGDLGVRDLSAGVNKLLTNTGGWEKSGGQFAQDSVFSPDGKQIVYNWFVKDGYELRIMNADGGGVRTVAFQNVRGYAVPRAWSPDGRTLAIVHYDQQGMNSLHLLNVATGELRCVIDRRKAPLWGMSYSPDGKWLAFDSGNWEFDSDIYLMPAAGGEPVPLVVHPAADLMPMWSSDGRSVLFASNRTGNFGLHQAPVENGRPAGNVKEIRSDLGARIWPIGFSRNGAFHYGLATRGTDIYEASYDATTGNVGKPVLMSGAVPGRNVAPAYSPDGKSLAWIMTSRFGASTNVVVRDLAEGKERRFPYLGQIWDTSWSRDGRRLLFQGRSQEPNTAELSVLDLESGQLSTLHQFKPSRNQLSAVFSADGQQVFAILREWPKDEWQIVALNLADRQVTSLCRLPVDKAGGRISGLALSPDGSQLAFLRRLASNRRVRLMTLPVTGGEPRLVVEVETQNDNQVRQVTYGPDGKFVLIRQGREKGETGVRNPSGLLRVDMTSGETKALKFEGEWVQTPTIHPSGRRIAFQAGFNETELWVAENILPPAQTVSAKRP